jgi:hypothetical protein
MFKKLAITCFAACWLGSEYLYFAFSNVGPRMTHVHFPLFGPFFDLQGLQVASWPHGVTKIICMVHNNNANRT